jgi:hypothetical protein
LSSSSRRLTTNWLRTEGEYLTASRAGQGTPLGKAQRRQVWAFTRWVEGRLRALGRHTFTQLANEAARALQDGAVKPPYRHIIIDEAQDLHPAHWRLLRAAVPAGPNDLFVVGDVHQRIYDNHVSLARVGINVRGRSKRLTVNYRTTQEILALAVPALGKASVTGLDDEADTLTGYRSPLASPDVGDSRYGVPMVTMSSEGRRQDTVQRSALPALAMQISQSRSTPVRSGR